MCIGNMGFQTTFDAVSSVVERHQSRGRSVQNVSVTTDGATVAVTMDVLVPFSSAEIAEPAAETTSADDDVRVELVVPALHSSPSSAVAFTVTDRSVGVADGGLSMQLEMTATVADTATDEQSQDEQSQDETRTNANSSRRVEPDPAEPVATEDDPDDQLQLVRDESVPPYEDVAYLEALYEACETFAEMREVIEMDVSAETVRRYMIDAGIHEPTDYETAAAETPVDSQAADEAESAGDEDAADATASTQPAASTTETPPSESLPDAQLIADGVGLPAHVEITDVIDAVVNASTVYQVRQDLGLSDTDTRALLKQLDVLDLVMCRLSRAEHREVTHEDAAARIRRSTAASE